MSRGLFLKLKKAVLILCALAFSSCSLLPFATSSYINKQLDKIPAGTSKKEIYSELGLPYFRINLASPGGGPVEVLGYELGNYWYHEPCMLVVREDRLVAASKDSYELLRLLDSLKVLPPADFWKSGDSEKAFPRRTS